jgi:hypothetical protein
MITAQSHKLMDYLLIQEYIIRIHVTYLWNFMKKNNLNHVQTTPYFLEWKFGKQSVIYTSINTSTVLIMDAGMTGLLTFTKDTSNCSSVSNFKWPSLSCTWCFLCSNTFILNSYLLFIHLILLISITFCSEWWLVCNTFKMIHHVYIMPLER